MAGISIDKALGNQSIHPAKQYRWQMDAEAYTFSKSEPLSDSTVDECKIRGWIFE